MIIHSSRESTYLVGQSRIITILSRKQGHTYERVHVRMLATCLPRLKTSNVMEGISIALSHPSCLSLVVLRSVQDWVYPATHEQRWKCYIISSPSCLWQALLST